ncbi:MAG TPA: class I SAM-dependent methyltransferase [Solirubrobacteraceae bacterium]|nr:class I SAM-dependent methyltransferase [Solirubrobacteraceae bacterium]
MALDGGDDGLACPGGEVFPVRAGVPRFVPDDGYAAAFGSQWLQYRLTQLDSHTGLPISEERARRCLGEELWNSLAGASVLECGCGAGRFTEVLLGRGARVTSIDLSAAVDVNASSFPPGPAHRVAQADILRLPLAPRQFDVVFCLGVVQHTPSPEATMHALYEQVAAGGWLVVDHYHHVVLTRVSQQLLRPLFLQMTPQAGLRWSERLVRTMLPIHKRLRRHERLLARISPVVSNHRSYPELDDRLKDDWAAVDTHDALTDRYKHRRSVRSLRRTLQSFGACEIVARRGGNGVEARAQRPPR